MPHQKLVAKNFCKRYLLCYWLISTDTARILYIFFFFHLYLFFIDNNCIHSELYARWQWLFFLNRLEVEVDIEVMVYLDKFNNDQNDKDCSVGNVGHVLIVEKSDRV